MNATSIAEHSRVFQEAESRHLAVKAGMLLALPRDRDNPDTVLRRATPVQAWLLSGSGDEDDMRARRRAVQHHMNGLTEAAQYAGTPVRCPVRDFIAGAEKYYAALTGGQS